MHSSPRMSIQYGSVESLGSQDLIGDKCVEPKEEAKIQSSATQRTKPSNEYVLNIAFFSFVGFLSVQALFAIVANSQSMLADSESMSIDAVTYLFNLLAEKMKRSPLSDIELRMTPSQCQRNRELRGLYLELVPPAISVVTLMCITIFTFREALSSLRNDPSQDPTTADEDVSVLIMFIFSSVNLLLDFLNVTCFARANSLFGFDMFRKENEVIQESLHDIAVRRASHVDRSEEKTTLTTGTMLSPSIERGHLIVPNGIDSCSHQVHKAVGDNGQKNYAIFSNLNMCSAWTHICADTLRSLSVIIASSIALMIPAVNPATADSLAALAVSFIIFCSLIPLLQGLTVTALRIITLLENDDN